MRDLKHLLFVGFNKRIAALDRRTGELMWDWKAEKGSGFVSLLLDGDVLFASVSGYTYSIDPLTGTEHWMNPLAGFGHGVTCLATVTANNSVSFAAAAQAAEDEAAAAAAASGGAG